jgi:hypothetical protein
MTQVTNDQSITTTITVDATPEQAYAAINNPRGWWSADITGVTDEDTTEWDDTEIRFDIWQDPSGTRVRFTHVGITPEVECYEICNTAWGSYIGNSLNRLIDTGVGDPNQERTGGSQEAQAQEALRRAAERTA